MLTLFKNVTLEYNNSYWQTIEDGYQTKSSKKQRLLLKKKRRKKTISRK